MKFLWLAILVPAAVHCFAGSVTANVQLTVVRTGQQEYDDYHPGIHVGSINTQGTSVPTKFCWLHVSDGKTLYKINMKKQGMFAHDCPDFQIGQIMPAYYEAGKHWREIWLMYRDRKGQEKAFKWTVVEKGNAKTLQ
jgi:hypothetical protein